MKFKKKRQGEPAEESAQKKNSEKDSADPGDENTLNQADRSDTDFDENGDYDVIPESQDREWDLEDQLTKALHDEDIPTEPETPTRSYIRPPKKKRRILPAILILLLVAAVAAGGGFWYYLQWKAPQDVMESFMSSVQEMDFDAMADLLQSRDLTILDDADVRDEAYTEFFREINSKLSWQITKTRLNLSSGTAQVTVRVTYIDGTQIYTTAITEFLRQIASSALAGESMTEEEIRSTLASILTEKAGEVADVYTDLDITYPLIQVDSQWKIVSLDEETVKVMSANFVSAEEELNSYLNQDSDTSTQTDVSDADSTDDAQTTAAGNTIDLTCDSFSIQYSSYAISTDLEGNSCLLVYYVYSNTGSTASSAMVDVNLSASQNGSSLSAAIPNDLSNEAYNQYMEEVETGQSVTVCQAFTLNDTSSPVTLEASAALSLGTDSTSQVINLS
ncbi:MAG: DUF5067 domain-containing protein [Clostridiales bacterium]|nr:DUF5067 domain-containing protein [Clostridiales bacterium]